MEENRKEKEKNDELIKTLKEKEKQNERLIKEYK